MASTERGERTRERLVRAAAEVVRTRGIGATTTRTIAAAAGVSEATIYRHFPDKSALIFAALLERDHPAIAWIEEFPGRAGTGTVAGNLAEAMGRLAEIGAEIAPIELAILSDPDLARRRNSLAELVGLPAFIADYVRAEQALGRLRTDLGPERIAMVVMATLFGIVAGTIGTAGPLDPAVVQAAASVLVDGMRADDTSD
jgi:AcrR family transcriptional regulator